MEVVDTNKHKGYVDAGKHNVETNKQKESSDLN